MPKGGKTRRTMLKEIMAEVADEAIQKRMPKPVAPNRKKAIEHLDDMLHLYVGLASAIQQKLVNELGSMSAAAIPLSEDTRFRYSMEQAKDCASKLAPYQSPTFRAVIVAPAPEQPPGELRKRFTLTIFDDSKAIEDQPTHPAPDGQQ